MKRKIVISTIIVFILLLIMGIVILNNKTNYFITLDINPSIKINLTKSNVVKSVEAMNDDAKDIISNNLKGKNIDDVLKIITDKVIEEGYAEENKIVILVYSKSNIDTKKIEKELKKDFEEKDIYTEVMIIKNISKEDKELAKKYNITPAKAAYINSLKKDNSKLEIKELIDKSVRELKETKESGFYCENGYSLEGDHCFKEIRQEKASKGQICPFGYYEYNGECYKEEPATDGKNYVCHDNFRLEGKKCLLEEEDILIPSKYNCSSGELGLLSDFGLSVKGSGDDRYVCLDKSNAKAPTLRCLTINHTMINGECYVGPAPLINGGCPGNDVVVGGGCYSKDDGDQWVCPDGRIYEKSKNSVPTYCPDTISYKDATVTEYKCNDGFALKNNKCYRKREEDAFREKVCPSGYSLVDNDRCINFKNKTSKQDGYVCNNDSARVKNNICIIYNIKEALHN